MSQGQSSPHADHMARPQSPHNPMNDDTFDPAQVLTREFWDSRYSSAEQVWSGNPNPLLVSLISDLEPGHALDMGCGEGADAMWLAARGWRVTAVDVSTVALERGAQQAAALGPDIAERIAWQQVDMLTWIPPEAEFDLVTAHFIHLPSPGREALHRALAAAVRPGGTLLIVGHHPSDLETSAGRWRMREFLFTEDEIASVLEPEAWDIQVKGSPAREARDPEGQPITIRDAVVKACRRA